MSDFKIGIWDKRFFLIIKPDGIIYWANTETNSITEINDQNIENYAKQNWSSFVFVEPEAYDYTNG